MSWFRPRAGGYTAHDMPPRHPTPRTSPATPPPPRSPDMLEARRLQRAGAGGMDPLRDWDDILNAVRCLKSQESAMRRVTEVRENRVEGVPDPRTETRTDQ